LVVENPVAGISILAQPMITPTSPTGQIAERINFALGSTIATAKESLQAPESDQYVLRALSGQTIMVDLSFESQQ
jgi:hypothetical protein